MAEVLKSLGQSAPGAVLTDLYTVPASKQTVIGNLVVCNQATSAKTFRVTFAPAGAADAAVHRLYYDTSIPASETLEILKGLTMATTDVLRVYGVDTNVSFTLFGDEMDV